MYESVEGRCDEHDDCIFYFQCLDKTNFYKWNGWTKDWKLSKEGKKKFWLDKTGKFDREERLKLPKHLWELLWEKIRLMKKKKKKKN